MQALLDELRKIEKYEENGAFVRSRSDICDEADEIPNKFFFHVKKNKQEKTIITNLQHADSSAILINQAEIKEHLKGSKRRTAFSCGCKIIILHNRHP